MDTHGHRECAALGEEILAKALTASGREGWRTTAFYLGNWLTDVSQAVDPVAYEEFADAIVPAIDGLVDLINGALIGLSLASPLVLFGRLDKQAIHNRIVTAAELFRGGREGALAKAVKAAFRVVGFYEFVHPDPPGGRRRMDFTAYKAIFDERYTQYYPHEHLDRWPVDQTAGSGPSSVYPYLLDHIKIAAGLLAHIDHEWAASTFFCNKGMTTARKEVWRSDEDITWNMWLAKFGHALHAIEDYFSHSNFTELAIQALADLNAKELSSHEQKLLPPDDGLAHKVFSRRLKRYGEPGGNEDGVVTGYFDKVDTFFSLSHVMEELFPDKPPNVYSRSTRAALHLRDLLRRVQKMMDDGADGSTIAATRILADRAIKDKLGTNDPEFEALFGGDELKGQLNYELKEIRKAVIEVIAQLSLRGQGMPMSPYEALVFWATLADLVESPLDFLEYLVGGPLKWLTAPVQKLLEPILRNILEQMLGRYRIGCHSLLAKDYLWDRGRYIDKLFRTTKGYSMAVHSFVVEMMTRWARPYTAAVCRSTTSGSAAKSFNTINRWIWIDWHSLLSNILRHPKDYADFPATVWWRSLINGNAAWFHFRYTNEAGVQELAVSAADRRATAENRYVPPNK